MGKATSRMALAALTGAMLASAAAPALATATSYASLSNFGYTLYDLDLNDGIAPSISFLTTQYGSRVTGQAQSNDWSPEMAGFDQTAAAPFAGLAGVESTAWASAAAQVVGDGSVAGFQLLAASGAAHGNGLDYGGYDAAAYTPYMHGDFTVSANTLVVFSATSTVRVHTTGHARGSPGQYEQAAAWNSMAVFGDGPSGALAGGGASFQSSGSSLYGLAISTFDEGSGQTLADDFFATEQASIAYLNLRAVEWYGTLAMSAQVWGSSNIAPVPEAHGWAMMLAGLMLTFTAALRRRKP